MGRTAHEKQYIIETVLDHLPKVTGSEGELKTWVVPKHGVNSISTHNEFGEMTDVQPCQTYYLITVEADLRDRNFDEGVRAFVKWLTRFAKRVTLTDILVRINDYERTFVINERRGRFHDLFELPSWVRNSIEVNWCEYLMWDSKYGTMFPAMLAYKYYADPENDKEIDRRLAFRNGEPFEG